MEKYIAESDHIFFDQISMFVINQAGQSSAVNLIDVVKKIGAFQKGISDEISSLKSLSTGSMTLKAVGHKGKTTILDLGYWIQYISGHKSERPDQITFETDFEANEAEKTINSPHNFMINDASFIPNQTTCHAIGMAYENIKPYLVEKLGNAPLKWPIDLQFFRHARNASFHANDFDIRNYRGEPAIDESSPPQWRHFIIPGQSLNGTRFAGLFFPYHMVLPFLSEIGTSISKL